MKVSGPLFWRHRSGKLNQRTLEPREPRRKVPWILYNETVVPGTSVSLASVPLETVSPGTSVSIPRDETVVPGTSVSLETVEIGRASWRERG